MAQQGNLSRWDIQVTNQVIGTAGTKTYLGASSYNRARSLYARSIQVYNSGTGTAVAGVVEVSNDNTYWGTLAVIAGGTLGAASSWLWSGSTTFGYIRASVAYAADMIGTASLYIRYQ